MSKFLTAKAIGNRIKVSDEAKQQQQLKSAEEKLAKGLQKLRWYCQMCEKQCRDENGFKCHCLSETHTRQMALFRDDPTKFMDQYSKEFQQFFMDVMKRKGGLRVKANTVYQEVVADRTHIHMNSTQWPTLGNFVQYLGKSGLCRVDQNEQGWWVQYIDRDPRVVARQEEIAKRAEQSLDEEERASERIQKQIEEARAAEEAARAQAALSGEGEGTAAVLLDAAQPTELKEDRGEEEKIAFSLSAPAHSASAASASAAAAASPAAAASSSSSAVSSSGAAASAPAAASSSSSSLPVSRAAFSMSFAKPSLLSAFGSSSSTESGDGAGGAGSKRKGAPSHVSTLDALMAEHERTKGQEQAAKKLRAEAAPPAAAAATPAASAASSSKRLDHWLHPQIVVKILNKKLLGGALYKLKGVVERVHDGGYVAELKLLPPGAPPNAPPGTVLRIDQAELETVIPAIGKLVRVVNGPYRGEIAVLLELHEARFSAKLRIESGVLRGREVDGVEYEDICKMPDA